MLHVEKHKQKVKKIIKNITNSQTTCFCQYALPSCALLVRLHFLLLNITYQLQILMNLINQSQLGPAKLG